MKKFFDDILYYLGQIGIALVYLLYFIFSWTLVIIVVPLLITYWFILKLFGRNPGKLSNIIRINKRRET